MVLSKYDTYWDSRKMALAINPKQVEMNHGVVDCGTVPNNTCIRIMEESNSSDNLCVQGNVSNKEEYQTNLDIREVKAFIINEKKLWLDELVLSLTENALGYLCYDVVGLLERPQLLKYSEGSNGYDWHTDLGNGQASTRKISISLALNDEYEGGEIEFFSDKVYTFDLKKGQAIAFPSFMPHRVKPITSGERWSLVSWIGGYPFR